MHKYIYEGEVAGFKRIQKCDETYFEIHLPTKTHHT